MPSTKSINPEKVTAELIRQTCLTLEFVSRVILVNFPLYLHAVSPELDRACSLVFAYLTLQVMGFAGAAIANASLALACRITTILPPLFSLTTENIAPSLEQTLYESPFSTLQLLLTYYVSYASMRMMVGFAQGIFQIALESIQDFPEAAQLLAGGGITTLELAPIVFVPVLLSELGIIFADPICTLTETQSSGIVPLIVSKASKFACDYAGLRFFTTPYMEARRMIFIALVIVTIQLYQASLQTFPNWHLAMRELSPIKYSLYQIGLVTLVFSTLLCILVASLQNKMPIIIMTIVLFGWGVWLCVFMPVLVRKYGRTWSDRITPSALQAFAANLRLSFVLYIVASFVILTISSGFLQAQLDITFVTFALPALYCTNFLLMTLFLQAGPTIMFWGIPIALIGATLVQYVISTKQVNYHMSALAGMSGNGSVILVWVHMLSRIVNFFGDDGPLPSGLGGGEWEPDEYDTFDGEDNRMTLDNDEGDGDHIDHYIDDDDDISDIHSTPLHQIYGDLATFDGYTTTTGVSGVQESESTQLSKEALATRGHGESSLVSLGFSNRGQHFLVRYSRHHLRYLSTILHALFISDSLLNGVVRGFLLFVFAFTIFVGTASLGSYAQKQLKMFPKLVSLHVDRDLGVLHFGHTISNVTLYYRNNSVIQPDKQTSCPMRDEDENLIPPYYAVCDWRWRLPESSRSENLTPLSIIDFSIMSQLAYYDDEPRTTETVTGSLQNAMSHLFPHLDFRVHSPAMPYHQRTREEGPVFVEFKSKMLGVTVIAIRGTDPGRLLDILEDIKLYAEPVVFTVLSTIFPTIRLWTAETTSRVIEWLYYFNSFLGLQSEATYYRALVNRVMELDKLNQELENGESVVLTGHSLGGGLARIVGTLTGVPSVTFAPPGIGLSYRKYRNPQSVGDTGEERKKEREYDGKVHHKSVAVVTEYDLISQIDHQVGLVQTIVCDTKVQSVQNSCHMLEGTICHLLNHCGDNQPDRFAYCRYEFNLPSLAPTLYAFIKQRIWILLPTVGLILLMIILVIIPEML